MPRGKVKSLVPTDAKKSKTNKKRTISNSEKQENKSIETMEQSKHDTGISTISDLKQFEYVANTSTHIHRPHVKIEYEQDSPVKEEAGLWEPPKWREFLLNLKIMRANNDAPVDTMGCHKAMDPEADPKVMRYQSLIALMLSSQTKDQVTFAAMDRLKAKGLNVENVLEISDEELGQLIYPVGFWKTKVKYIKKTTQTLKEQYNSDIPDSVDKLCKLTGVGPKMAHICMKVAWNRVTGIGVDTHVHRISNRIGWVRKPTATPEDTRKALETWLPFDLWSEVNHLMVGFGQTICLPIGPMCHECLNNDICPSSGLGRKSPKKTPIKTPNKSPAKPINKEELDEVKTKLDLDTKLPKRRKMTLKQKDIDTRQNYEDDTEKRNKSIKQRVNIIKTEAVPKKETTKDHGDLYQKENIGTLTTKIDLIVEPIKKKSPRIKKLDEKPESVKTRSRSAKK